MIRGWFLWIRRSRLCDTISDLNKDKLLRVVGGAEITTPVVCRTGFMLLYRVLFLSARLIPHPRVSCMSYVSVLPCVSIHKPTSTFYSPPNCNYRPYSMESACKSKMCQVFTLGASAGGSCWSQYSSLYRLLISISSTAVSRERPGYCL